MKVSSVLVELIEPAATTLLLDTTDPAVNAFVTTALAADIALVTSSEASVEAPAVNVPAIAALAADNAFVTVADANVAAPEDNVPVRTVLLVTASEASVEAPAVNVPAMAALAADNAFVTLTAPVLAETNSLCVNVPVPTPPSKFATLK
jgi:hypothetical protein